MCFGDVAAGESVLAKIGSTSLKALQFCDRLTDPFRYIGISIRYIKNASGKLLIVFRNATGKVAERLESGLYRVRVLVNNTERLEDVSEDVAEELFNGRTAPIGGDTNARLAHTAEDIAEDTAEKTAKEVAEEYAKSEKLLRERVDNPDSSNALFRNAEAVNALTRLRNNPILRKLGLTDEIASKLKGAENLSFTQIIDNLENFVRKIVDNNVELKDFNKVLRQLTEGGGKSDGANWVITYITKHIGEFKGRKLVFEEFNSTTLGGRFVDVTDETIVRSKVFYEFKSVKTVPPKDFAEQFMKDLSNADNLSQIKWIFNGSKNPVDFRKNMLEAIDNIFNSKNSNIQRQLRQISEKITGFDDINILKSDIINNFNNIFNKID